MQSQELNEPRAASPDDPREAAAEELAELYEQPLSVRDRHLGLLALGQEQGSW